jgi:hypothetical protein
VNQDFPSWTDLLRKYELPAVSWHFVEQRCNLAIFSSKMAIFVAQKKGSKFKNISYCVYWDQYQDFETPDFWKAEFLQTLSTNFMIEKNLTTLLFDNVGSRNKTAYSEF